MLRLTEGICYAAFPTAAGFDFPPTSPNISGNWLATEDIENTVKESVSSWGSME